MNEITVDVSRTLVIDPIAKTIRPKYRNQKAVYIAKGDHNSVLIRFEIPRYVDGNDMSTEGAVKQIHYVNMDGKDESKYSKGFSDAINVLIEKDEVTDEDIVSFCWLVPKTATRYVGVVSIGITFKEYENVNGKVDEKYSWSTFPYGKTIVGDSHDNDVEAVEREYNYLIETCNAIVKTALNTNLNYLVTEVVEEIKESGELKGDPFEYSDFTPEQLEGLKGKDGTSPSVNVESIEGGHRVNITDAEKTSSFDVMDGKDGKGDIDEANNFFAGALKGSALGVTSLTIDDIDEPEHDVSVKATHNGNSKPIEMKMMFDNFSQSQTIDGVTVTIEGNTFNVSGNPTTPLYFNGCFSLLPAEFFKPNCSYVLDFSSTALAEFRLYGQAYNKEIDVVSDKGENYGETHFEMGSIDNPETDICSLQFTFALLYGADYYDGVSYTADIRRTYGNINLDINGTNHIVANGEEITVKSIYPTMNVVADSEYVSLEVGYNKAVEKVIEEKAGNNKDASCFTNALKGKETGAIVSMKDVSPIEHEIGVKASSKNLANLLEGYDTSGGNITNTVLQSGKSGYYCSCIPVEPNTIYMITKQTNTSGRLRCFFYDREPVIGETMSIGGVYYDNFTYIKPTSPANAKYMVVAWGNVLENFQIEKGTTSTPYTPYVEDVSKAKVLKCGKNIVNFPVIKATDSIENAKIPCYITSPVTVSGVSDNVVVQNANGENVSIWRIQAVYKDGKTEQVMDTHFATSCTFKLASESNPIIRLNYRTTFMRSGEYKDIQIELGTVATEYEPYIEPIEYPISSDGTVEGVNSLCPSTTLYSDTVGVLIEAIYNKDINKNIETSNSINKPTTLAGYGITDAYTAKQVDNKITESETAMATLMDEKIAEISTAGVRKFKILLNADGWFSEPSEGGGTPDEYLDYFDIAHTEIIDLGIEYTEKGVGELSEKYAYGGHPEKAVFVQLASAYNGVVTTLEQRRAYDKIKLHTIVRGYSGLNENGDVEYFYYLGIGIMGDTKPTVDIPIEVIIV